MIFPWNRLEFLEKEGNPGLPWPMVVDIGVQACAFQHYFEISPNLTTCLPKSQILHALRTMEEEEYVHGDLKLENIMVKR